MTSESQAIYLNAVPLLALGALYLAAAATLAPALWRERARTRALDLAPALVFPAGGIAATLFGLVVLEAREPVGNRPWLVLVGVVVASIPALLYFARFPDRELVITGPRRALESEERQADEARRRDALARATADLTAAGSVEDLGRRLAAHACELFAVDFAAFNVVDGPTARGVAARLAGEDMPWDDVVVDAEAEPSGIASAVVGAAPITIYEVGASPIASRRLRERIGARSAMFVPLLGEDGVVGVLSLATRSPRAFTPAELALGQELAAEAALALERLRSATALAEALERERLVARISGRLRSESELGTLLDVAVSETGPALSADRCFVRLAARAGSPTELREWRRSGLRPVSSAERLPVSELAEAERRTVAVEDIEADSALEGRQHLVQLGSLAALATPIVVLDEVIGVVGAHRAVVRRWTADEVALVEAVAREVGLAVRTARLLDENRRRLGQQESLLKAAHALTGDLELDSVMRRLVAEAVRLVGGDAADCWIFEGEGSTLRCRAVFGLPASEIGRRIRAEGNMRASIERGRPLLKRRFGETERPEPSEPYRVFAEVMDAPISAGGRVRGVLGVCAREEGTFDEEHLEVLGAFARLASLALENAEVFEERSRQARVQRSFSRIAAVLAEPLSRSETLEAVAHAAVEALGGAHAGVVARGAGGLALVGGYALPPALEATLAAGLSAGEPALADAAGSGRVIASSSLAGDERFAADFRKAAAVDGARSLVGIPVAFGDGELTLVLVFFDDERRLSDDDLELAQHLARVARASLERSLVFEEERSARSLAQHLARTSSVLATELDPAAVLEEVVREAPALVGVEAAAIRLVEGDELVVSAVHGLARPAQLLGERSPVTGWLAGDVVQSRGPLALEDTAADQRHLAADSVLRTGFRAYAGVPLVAAEGVVHGVLSLYGSQPKAWTQEEIEALSALAAGASAALQNAELYQRVAIEKERSVAILANIADGIVAVDRDGGVVLWNRAAEQITGVRTEQALGRTPLQVLGRRLESDGGAAPGDRVVSILRGGEEVWLSLTEAVMRDPAGAVAGRIYAFRDISSDRLVEQMKTEFVTTVSQELRRPLTSIYGFAETLLRRDVDFGEDERRTFLGYIASESERLTSIVDALLSVARLDAGDLQIALAPTDVAAAVAETVAGQEQSAAGNGHRFVVELPDEPLAAHADPDKLRQVLANLLDNAVKYSPAGGTVTVAARRHDDRVEISVADRGIGIPEGEQERIFRKFYRADAAALRAGGGGTGLGLFIVRGLVRAMGGRIWVSSREGEGSSFTFELPAAPAAVRSESEPERV
ncbi:MAG TPA: GAF domain-containing protein [Gaiellaceae bacterium]|nr:GAF domain-containing protein [Gaiellaceae bacterium]